MRRTSFTADEYAEMGVCILGYEDEELISLEVLRIHNMIDYNIVIKHLSNQYEEKENE